MGPLPQSHLSLRQEQMLPQLHPEGVVVMTSIAHRKLSICSILAKTIILPEMLLISESLV